MQHLSGVATLTAVYVEEVKGTGATIIDTRKTLPGLRALEKHAVRCGGGHNHRQNLGDGILIKDNHIAALRGHGMSLGDIVRQAHAAGFAHHQGGGGGHHAGGGRGGPRRGGAAAVAGQHAAGADAPGRRTQPGVRAVLEASGGINLDTVRAVAETGVDLISVGALTHSAPSVDISMDIAYEGVGGQAKGVASTNSYD